MSDYSVGKVVCFGYGQYAGEVCKILGEQAQREMNSGVVVTMLPVRLESGKRYWVPKVHLAPLTPPSVAVGLLRGSWHLCGWKPRHIK